MHGNNTGTGLGNRLPEGPGLQALKVVGAVTARGGLRDRRKFQLHESPRVYVPMCVCPWYILILDPKQSPRAH